MVLLCAWRACVRHSLPSDPCFSNSAAAESSAGTDADGFVSDITFAHRRGGRRIRKENVGQEHSYLFDTQERPYAVRLAACLPFMSLSDDREMVEAGPFAAFDL